MTLDNSTKAVDFLKAFIPNGYWVLTAIHPETKKVATATFAQENADECIKWVDGLQGKLNLYFSVNQPAGPVQKKLTKQEIVVVEYLHVDIDPEKGKEFEAQQKRIFDKLTVRRPEGIPRPTAIVFSGGGYQAFWKLETPIAITPENIEAIEMYNIGLADALGGDHCHDISRVMRLPWTMNLPNAVKQKAGRVEVLAKLKQIEEISHKLTDFIFESPDTTAEPEAKKPAIKKVDEGAVLDKVDEDLVGGPEAIDDLQELQDKYGVPTRTLLIIREGEGDEEEKLKKTQAGRDLSRSGWLFDVVCELERRNVPRRVILGILMEENLDRWKISESVLDHATGPLRYGTKQIRDAAKVVAEQRLEQARQVDEVEEDQDITELIRALSYGERAKTVGVTTKDEAEELDPLLKLMNSRFTFIRNVGGKPRIVSFYTKKEIGNGLMKGTNKVAPTDFHAQFPGMMVTTGFSEGKDGQPGKPITSKLTEWWLKHRYKNEKERIVFSPSVELPNCLNEWKGFTYEADHNGKFDLFLAHVRDNVCNSNEEHYNYLVKWCARMFQYPGRVGEVAVVLKGGSGVGKSFFVEELAKLVVSNFYQTAKMDRLTANFNAILRTTVFLFLDEALFAGNKQQYDVVKKFLVSTTLDVEAKGYEQETVGNNLHVCVASNHNYVVPAQADDRRLFVLEVADKQKQVRAYFKAAQDQLEENDNSGYKALFHYFLNLDLTEFDVANIPQTDALKEQKDLALGPLDEWLLDRLSEGEILRGSGEWPSLVVKNAVLDDVLEDANRRRLGKWEIPTGAKLGRYLVKTLGVDPRGTIRPTRGAAPVAAYKLPILEEARRSWNKIHGKTEWPEILNPCETTTQEEAEEQIKEVATEVTKGKYKDGGKNTPF